MPSSGLGNWTPAEGVGVGGGGVSLGGSEASGSGLSQEIAHWALPPADLNATRPAPLSAGVGGGDPDQVSRSGLELSSPGVHVNPPEVVADHERAASRAASRI